MVCRLNRGLYRRKVVPRRRVSLKPQHGLLTTNMWPLHSIFLTSASEVIANGTQCRCWSSVVCLWECDSGIGCGFKTSCITLIYAARVVTALAHVASASASASRFGSCQLYRRLRWRTAAADSIFDGEPSAWLPVDTLAALDTYCGSTQTPRSHQRRRRGSRTGRHANGPEGQRVTAPVPHHSHIYIPPTLHTLFYSHALK